MGFVFTRGSLSCGKGHAWLVLEFVSRAPGVKAGQTDQRDWRGHTEAEPCRRRRPRRSRPPPPALLTPHATSPRLRRLRPCGADAAAQEGHGRPGGPDAVARRDAVAPTPPRRVDPGPPPPPPPPVGPRSRSASSLSGRLASAKAPRCGPPSSPRPAAKRKETAHAPQPDFVLS